MRNRLFTAILILKLALLIIGGTFIYEGIKMVNIPLSLVFVGVFCMYLGHPEKVKRTKHVDN